MDAQKQIKSKKRVADHGEVFTPQHIVNDMLDLVKNETERVDSRFLEPACGNGNFLIEILRRKLAVVKGRYKKSQAVYERYSVIAVCSCYGVDILEDNCNECRERLLKLFETEYKALYKKKARQQIVDVIRFVLLKNIVCGNALTMTAANGEPIVFCEWSAVNHTKMKRRDFRLDHLLKSEEKFAKSQEEASLLGAEHTLPQEVGNGFLLANFDELHYQEPELAALYRLTGIQLIQEKMKLD